MSVISIKGIYQDRLWSPDGGLIFDSGWRSNVIVMRCRELLAGFLKNEVNTLGIRSLKVGRGDAAWDAAGAPAPADTATQLVDASPFAIPHTSLLLQYLNPLDQIVAGPTNRIQIVATLGPGQPRPAADPPYPLREFGLFGQLNGMEYMIDYIRHPLIEKDGATTLERKVRLIF